MESVSISSSIHGSPGSGEAAARKSSYGSPAAPVSSTRITRTPARSSGLTSPSSSWSTKTNFAPELERHRGQLRAVRLRLPGDAQHALGIRSGHGSSSSREPNYSLGGPRIAPRRAAWPRSAGDAIGLGGVELPRRRQRPQHAPRAPRGEQPVGLATERAEE